LIEAFHILNSKFKIQNSKLLLVGDGSEKENLKLKIENLKLGDSVIFAGSVGHYELPKYLRISDVFVRPSRSEGLGSAFLEAMAASLPVIGTKVGGIPDFLKNKETGLFAEVDSPENLAEKINLLLTDKELRENIIRNAKEMAVQKYDWDKIAGEFKKLYLELDE
ncbi:MAG: glycosyltransferase family 4 protein, partial [Candidatus Yanofskybacteria bacterium]|nr:glycosyltransferase family 4 protein [Candidatus Yanofskybacteria bacterium]